MGMYYGGQNYIFSKNLQGDVIGIYNENRQLVAKYSYNAYGEIMSITDASGNDVSGNASHIANGNPFRYRGYYYDTETGFYYLQSRYYDPVVGRFLNADIYVSTGQGIIGYNMLGYCNNNPINLSDSFGTWPKWWDDTRDWLDENVLEPIGDICEIVVDNFTVTAGACIGFGGSINVGPAEVQAEMREDIIGVQVREGQVDIGNNGKSGASIGIGRFSVGSGSETFESWTTGEREVYESTHPTFDVGIGLSFSCFVGAHAGISLSISGIIDDIIQYCS